MNRMRQSNVQGASDDYIGSLICMHGQLIVQNSDITRKSSDSATLCQVMVLDALLLIARCQHYAEAAST